MRVRWGYLLLGAIVLSVALAAIFRLSEPRRLTRTWTQDVPDTGVSKDTMAIGPDGIYLTSSAGELVKLSFKGAELWRVALPGGRQPGWNHPLAGVEGTVFVGSSASKVACVSSAGLLLWTAVIRSTNPRDRVTPVGLHKNGSLAVSGNQKLVWLDQDGKFLFEVALPGHHGFRPPLVAGDGSVYFIQSEGLIFSDGVNQDFPGSKQTFLVRLDPGGKVLWRQPGEFLAAYSRVQFDEQGNLLIPMNHEGVVCYSPAGKRLWLLDVDVSIVGLLGQQKNRIYVGGRRAITAADQNGQVQWRLEDEGSFHSIFARPDGSIYCIEECFTEPVMLVQLRHKLQKQSNTQITSPAVTSYLLLVSSQGRILRRHPLRSDSASLLGILPDGSALVSSKPRQISALHP